MAGPSVTLSAVPSGGAVLLKFPEYIEPPAGVSSVVIERSVSGTANWVQIYTGDLLFAFLDVGDMLPAPLDQGTAYEWRITDSRGQTVIGPLTPSSTVTTAPDQLSQILIRLLQGAINALVLPNGIQRTKVTTKMPQNGWQAMPFIVANLDLIQQTELQIGEDVPNPDQDNNWTLFANAKRVWRVSVLSVDAEERDFYRDSLLAIFRASVVGAFAAIGLNVTHSFQAASYTDANAWEGKTPGFYGCDVMFEIDGVFPLAILTGFSVIRSITVTPTIGQPVETP